MLPAEQTCINLLVKTEYVWRSSSPKRVAAKYRSLTPLYACAAVDSLGGSRPVHGLGLGGHCQVPLVCMGPVPDASLLADMAQVALP